MKKNIYKIVFPVFVAALVSFSFIFTGLSNEDSTLKISKMRRTGSPKAEANAKAGRDEYFLTMLKDPKTNVIPADVVINEMNFAKEIRDRGLRKSNAVNFVSWKEAGPTDVGGRTRAIGVDVREPKNVLAAGVSGGIWKSTNKGTSWSMKFTSSQALSVTGIAQDTRAGHEDTWYASTGEFDGNSASGSGAAFRGAGIYKSTDNGDTWTLLPKVDDVTVWDHPLDYILKIAVNPVTGSVFIGSSGFGLYKSTNEGSTFEEVIESKSNYCEFDIASNGNIIAVFSEEAPQGSTVIVSGVKLSSDDGTTWTDITPSTWPVGTGYKRSVVEFAPSNENTVYILTEVDDANADHRLHKLNISGNSSEDLSANLPDFDGLGIYTSQGGYDMMLAVKPDDPNVVGDENVVVIGGTNIYRSFDGFSTKLDTDKDNQWIGGYDNADGNGSYTNSHPDIHSFAFEKDLPGRMWVGHDGGLSYTANIFGKKNIDFSSSPWQLKNSGYNVTQVYHISIPNISGDGRIIIGTQDNGSPAFSFTTTTSTSKDVSSGDGSYSYFGATRAYVSTQNGSIIQLGYDNVTKTVNNIWDNISPSEFYAFIHPSDAEDQLFINPFVVDPNDENVMYYPAGKSIWRNKNINGFERASGGWDGQNFSWTVMDALEAPEGYTYTAIDVSKGNDEHVLYFAAYKAGDKPLLYRLDNSVDNSGPAVDISIPALVNGAYIKEIAINPLNSNEILVVASNYNIVGLYHSLDGGATYTAVEGNLEGVGGKGPSLRSVEILPVDNGTIYFVGTSVGLFSTSSLNGSSTTWLQEGADVIGNVVVTSITSRVSDKYVAVGTHGRGVFTGTASSTVAIKQLAELPADYSLSQNYPNPFNPSTKIRYSVPMASNVSLKIYNSNGEEVAEVLNKYLPAGTFEADWNGTNRRGIKVASGVYFYTLRAGDFVQTKKMVMLK